MKRDEIPGYKEIRDELFQARYQLQLARSEEDFEIARTKLQEVKKRLANLMYENKIKEESKNKRGR